MNGLIILLFCLSLTLIWISIPIVDANDKNSKNTEVDERTNSGVEEKLVRTRRSSNDVHVYIHLKDDRQKSGSNNINNNKRKLGKRYKKKNVNRRKKNNRNKKKNKKRNRGKNGKNRTTAKPMNTTTTLSTTTTIRDEAVITTQALNNSSNSVREDLNVTTIPSPIIRENVSQTVVSGNLSLTTGSESSTLANSTTSIAANEVQTTPSSDPTADDSNVSEDDSHSNHSEEPVDDSGPLPEDEETIVKGDDGQHMGNSSYESGEEDEQNKETVIKDV